METTTCTLTTKRRRKFERVETINASDHDTSSVNHDCDEYSIDKLSNGVYEEAQTVAEREKNACESKSIDSTDLSGVRRNHRSSIEMNKSLLKFCHIILTITTAVGSGLSYCVCVYLDHADLSYLYISETGVDIPEMSILTQTISFIPPIVIVIMYTRHLIMKQYFRDKGQQRSGDKLLKINALHTAMVVVGIELIGNFPAIGSCYALHAIGGTLYCIGSMSLIVCVTETTRRTIGKLCTRQMYYIRLTLCTISIILLFVTLIPGIISWLQFNGTNYRRWKRSEGGWLLHNISIVGEWLYVITTGLYLSTLVHELDRTRFEQPEVKITYIDKNEKVLDVGSKACH